MLVEFEKGLRSFDAILQKWKADGGELRETYHRIFAAVKEFDKHIARRYDGIVGARYLETVVEQLADELYEISEIDSFNTEVKEDTLRFVKLRKAL